MHTSASSGTSSSSSSKSSRGACLGRKHLKTGEQSAMRRAARADEVGRDAPRGTVGGEQPTRVRGRRADRSRAGGLTTMQCSGPHPSRSETGDDATGTDLPGLNRLIRLFPWGNKIPFHRGIMPTAQIKIFAVGGGSSRRSYRRTSLSGLTVLRSYFPRGETVFANN